jgi:p-aminobenzoyl-glutamate transporter AbgT
MATQKEIAKITPAKLSKQSRKHSHRVHPIAQTLIAFAGIVFIVPAIIYGIMTFFGVGFKAGMNATISMYNEEMKDAQTWAK